jgi:hypothetical protein
MKKRPEFTRLGLPVALAAVVWLAGCAAQTDSHHLGKATGSVYDTPEQIQAMPPCKAVVVERGPCYVHLRAADGNEFFIGSPAAGTEVVQFLEVLKDGRTYRFPATFQKYQEQRRQARP